MKIKITADSTCDLTPAQIAENDIRITPLSVNKGGIFYTDGVDIHPRDIFDHVAHGGELCSTAAVNIADYEAVFGPLSAENDAVIHISLGSGFSSCYQNACVAAESFDNVYVVDSQNLSTGHGLLVLEACERCAGCTDPAALAEELRTLACRVETSFVLDRLDYMVKGGRCSMVAALGANLLKLRPCIEVKDGKMTVVQKYRGNYDKCLAAYVHDRLSDRQDLIPDKLFITHTPVAESDLQTVRSVVAENSSFARVMESEAGCTVSCHCGPGCLGVLFIRSK